MSGPGDVEDVTPATWAVLGGRPQGGGEPVNAPIEPTSLYLAGGERSYSREDVGAASVAVEDLVGGLEGGAALGFASGMAAVAAVFEQLPVGSAVAIPDDGYQGVRMLAERGARLGRWSLSTVAVTDTEGWQEALLNCDLVWLETPSNPLLQVTDLAAVCAAPRRDGCLVVVDNTVATPLRQRPLDLGADLVVHSATKFLGGHSDLLAGVVVVRDDDLRAALHHTRTLTGANLGLLEAFLLARGIRTLPLRLDRGEANAIALADWLGSHPAVTAVRHPGWAALLSFDTVGTADDVDAGLARLRVVHHATSLGGVESTCERRAAVEGQGHLPPTLIRMSVGCEDLADLQTDLARLLDPLAA